MEKIAHFLLDSIRARDTKLLAQQYTDQSEMLVIEDFLPRAFVRDNFIPEVNQCEQYIHRVHVPGFKKSGSVSRYDIKLYAPTLFRLYYSDAFKTFISNIVGENLVHCPERDPHAVALYYYTEPGDRISVHYDKSFYKGKRFTVLLGMTQDSEKSKLICYPSATKKNRRKNSVVVATHPGTLVIFNGDVLWHEVSALGEQEKRVILTMEFLTDARISLFNKLISDFKDRYLYFGKSKFESA